MITRADLTPGSEAASWTDISADAQINPDGVFGDRVGSAVQQARSVGYQRLAVKPQLTFGETVYGFGSAAQAVAAIPAGLAKQQCFYPESTPAPGSSSVAVRPVLTMLANETTPLGDLVAVQLTREAVDPAQQSQLDIPPQLSVWVRYGVHVAQASISLQADDHADRSDLLRRIGRTALQRLAGEQPTPIGLAESPPPTVPATVLQPADIGEGWRFEQTMALPAGRAWSVYEGTCTRPGRFQPAAAGSVSTYRKPDAATGETPTLFVTVQRMQSGQAAAYVAELTAPSATCPEPTDLPTVHRPGLVGDDAVLLTPDASVGGTSRGIVTRQGDWLVRVDFADLYTYAPKVTPDVMAQVAGLALAKAVAAPVAGAAPSPTTK